MTRPNRAGELEALRSRYLTLERALARAWLLVFLLTAITAISLTAALWVTVLDRPSPLYFATDPHGRITPLTPLDQPLLTDNQVINFGVQAVTRSLTLTFSGVRRELTAVRQYFEHPGGWNSFLTALAGSGVLEYIEGKRLNASTVAQGGRITQAGTDEQGRHSWIVQIPLVTTYESSSETARENYLAELRIVRLPTTQVPDGVGVAQIVIAPSR